MNRLRMMTAALIALSLAGCAIAPARVDRPQVAAAWQAMPTAGSAQQQDGAWWRAFGSAELDRLMDTALKGNLDWHAALARIEQSRALLKATEADAYPQASLDGSVSNSRNRSGGAQRTSTTSNSRQAGVSVSYEVDLWGRLAADRGSAKSSLAAARFSALGTRLLLETELASTYFQLCTLDERLALAKKNTTLARDTLTRVGAQRRLGAVDDVAVAQQRQLVESLAAGEALLTSQRHDAKTALAVLTGSAPQGFTLKTQAVASFALPTPAAGQPAELLTRRPDILQAEAQLAAAEADVASARAAFYPQLTLTAKGVVSAVSGGGTGVLTSLLAGLTQPLFDGGRLSASLSLNKARRDELVAAYKQTVLAALKEGEDALDGWLQTATRTDALGRSLAAARDAYRLSDGRYRAGAIDYLTLLDAQRTLIASEDGYLAAGNDRLDALLTLYKALGGAGRPA
ncbi:efflux transporter outer membrane subunit [Crenobacter cavernae]|nr:efflux transporter outer membrane subunit [Crenobacter cavernae]